MKTSRVFAAAAAVAVLTAGSAWAGECAGVGARKYAEPILIYESPDGAKTMLVQSTGINTVTRETNAVGGANWQHCAGLWTVNADKSGSGSGNCYSVDGDGDEWNVSWEGDNSGGTWAYVSGTGKYAGWTGGGTWTRGARYADGTRLTLWEGTCGE